MHEKPPVGEPHLIDDEATFGKYITWDNLPLRIEIHDRLFNMSNVIYTWIKIHKYEFVERRVDTMTTVFEREDI
jgi:hypothetical protein